MKCKRCYRNMETVSVGNGHYWRCPNCGYTVGAPKETENAGENQGRTEEDRGED